MRAGFQSGVRVLFYTLQPVVLALMTRDLVFRYTGDNWFPIHTFSFLLVKIAIIFSRRTHHWLADSLLFVAPITIMLRQHRYNKWPIAIYHRKTIM